MVRGQSKKRPDPELRLIEASIGLAERQRWCEITISDIAQESGLSVAEVLTIFPSKFLILEALSRRVDQAILNDLLTDSETGDSPKDRLFDILMRRFEALSSYKNGLASIMKDVGADPCNLLRQLSTLRNSMALTLEAAGISTLGPLGNLRIHGLIAIYTYCLNIWFRDGSPDLATTMAAVDRGVSLAEKISTRTHWGSRGTPKNTK